MGQYKKVIRKSKDNQYYFGILAENGESVGISEMYTRKDDAKQGFYDHAKAVLFVLAQEGKLLSMLEETGLLKDLPLYGPSAESVE